MESLKLKAIVKDAVYYKVVIAKPDGFIYHKDNNQLLGRTQSDIVEYLKNPTNEDMLNDILKKVEKYWNS